MARQPRETRETSSRKMPSDDYVSQFWINPDFLDTEQFHYKWVETHCMNAETQSVGTALRNGYEPVPLTSIPDFAKTVELMSAIRGKGQKDEFIRQGDQILMRCPKKIYENAKKLERREAKRQMNRLDWAEQSQSIKAPTFVSDNSYSRTHELSDAAKRAFADDEE